MEGNEIVETILTEILNEISEMDGKVQPYDFDEFEFLINTCGTCIEIFKYNFQRTTFAVNVTNKMFELIPRYIESLSKNTAFGIKDKIAKYQKYFQKLQDS